MRTSPRPIRIVAYVWAVLAMLIPAGVSVGLLIAPHRLIVPGLADADVLRVIAYRNFALSGLMAISLFVRPRQILPVLLIVRGATELADGFAGVFAAPAIAPFIGAAGDFVFAWVLWRSALRFTQPPEATRDGHPGSGFAAPGVGSTE